LARAGDGRPRLTFAPACANTIAEFESYAWRETGGAMRDEPEKINDHAMDALRYGVMYLDKPRRYFG
jgi:phage terminase large subunit